MKKNNLFSRMIGLAMIIILMGLFYVKLEAEYNIGTGFLARVSPVIAEGNMVAITAAGLLYDSGVSAYSAGTAAIHDTDRPAGWTDTLGGASLAALEAAFVQYADVKITGPGSAIDNQIFRADGTTGKIGQASYAYIDDTGNFEIPTSAIATIGKLKTVQISYDMSAGVTDAALDIACGAPGTLGAGYQASIAASVGTALYHVETDGTNWFFEEIEIAP